MHKKFNLAPLWGPGGAFTFSNLFSKLCYMSCVLQEESKSVKVSVTVGGSDFDKLKLLQIFLLNIRATFTFGHIFNSCLEQDWACLWA